MFTCSRLGAFYPRQTDMKAWGIVRALLGREFWPENPRRSQALSICAFPLKQRRYNASVNAVGGVKHYVAWSGAVRGRDGALKTAFCDRWSLG